MQILLEGYGFNPDQLDQIERSLEALSGKEFLSPTHRLVKDRNELRVYPLAAAAPDDLTFRLYPIGENEFGRKGGMLDVTFGENCLSFDDITCKKLPE